MEQLLSDLRRFYFRAFLLSVVFFFVCHAVARFVLVVPVVDAAASAYVMVALLAVTFAAFVVTWFLLRRARMGEATGEARQASFAKAYRARIAGMSAVSAVGSLCYLLTQDSNAAYVVLIASLLILLYYPSASFVGRQLDGGQNS